MNPGDIINIFTDPDKMEHFEGMAKLIHMNNDYGEFQEWLVEFLDCPNHRFSRLIKLNTQNGKQTNA